MEKQGGEVCTGLIWLRIVTIGVQKRIYH